MNSFKINFFILIFSALHSLIYAQSYPIDAPDFNVKDINGKSHILYDYLDQGKVVLLDVSATWCPPCWELHETHALENIHKKFGPDGTNQVVVLFYEGDSETDSLDLIGATPTSMGNWLMGTTYPVNDPPIVTSAFLDVYAPLGFPTVNVIDPKTKTIIADVYDFTEAQMVDLIKDFLQAPSNLSDFKNSDEWIVGPNPSQNFLKISSEHAHTDFQLTDISGRLLLKGNIGAESQIDLTNIISGHYTLTLTSDLVSFPYKINVIK